MAQDPDHMDSPVLSVRASDHDRARAVEALTAAYTQGALSKDELDERMTAAYAAREVRQLHQLTADLPPPEVRQVSPPAPAWSGPELWLLAALLILFPTGGIAWLILRAWQRRSPRLPGASGAPVRKLKPCDRAGACRP